MLAKSVQTPASGSAAIRRWPSANAKSWVDELLTLAATDQNVVAVVAIGSAVREGVNSVDLDLVMVVENAKQFTLKPPIEVDLRVYERSRVQSAIRSGDDLLGWAIMYGKALMERNAYWESLVENFRNQIPLPSIGVAEARAEKASQRFNAMVEVGDTDAAYEQALSAVTHMARALLIRNGKYPKSRPELPSDLRTVGCFELARCLEILLGRAPLDLHELECLVRNATDSFTNGR